MPGTSGIDGAWIAAISAMGAILAGSIAALAAYWLTRRREQENEWRKLRLEQYKEYLAALSGIADGRSTDAAQARYADAVTASLSSRLWTCTAGSELSKSTSRFLTRFEIGTGTTFCLPN